MAVYRSELIDIAKYERKNDIRAKRVGIFFPVYYWGLPNIIRNFASEVNIQAEYIFELHTMGGYDGVATEQLSDCLKKKNHILSASYRIKMPNNIALISKSNQFTDVYRVPGDKAIDSLIWKAKKKLMNFSNMILEEKSHHNKECFVFKPWHKFGYQLNATNTSQFHVRAQTFAKQLEHTCTGCGKCSKVCPMGNIRIIDGKPVWGDKCEFCLACLHKCPMGAINYDYSKGKKRYHFPNSGIK